MAILYLLLAVYGMSNPNTQMLLGSGHSNIGKLITDAQKHRCFGFNHSIFYPDSGSTPVPHVCIRCDYYPISIVALELPSLFTFSHHYSSCKNI